MASGKLQAICYKEEIEAALRTPGFGGYQLLDLHDFPGQGTALVGVLDAFWDSKGYASPDEYRCFAGPTVPLARFAKRVWTNDETLKVRVEVAHFGKAPLIKARSRYKITGSDRRVLDSDTLTVFDLPLGNGIDLGEILYPLEAIKAPEKLTLTLSLMGATHPNHWDFWVYPRNVEMPSVLKTEYLGEEAASALDAGGKVLIMPRPGRLRNASGMAFYPIFWNAQMFAWQKSAALGILVDPEHPVFRAFPTAFHADWQWWSLLNGSRAMNLKGIQPLVQVIDDWNTNRRQGLLFECRVGKGKVMVCSMDLENKDDPAARQMLYSVLTYMASDDFQPREEVKREVIERMINPPSPMQKLKIKVTADSEEAGNEARCIIDGDAATFWHTAWSREKPGYPHWVVLELETPVTVKGISMVERQDMANGRIGEYEVFISADGEQWGNAAGRGTVAHGTVEFDSPRTGRFVKLLALKPVHPDHPWASLAELELIVE
jgi:hypothetical protein